MVNLTSTLHFHRGLTCNALACWFTPGHHWFLISSQSVALPHLFLVWLTITLGACPHFVLGRPSARQCIVLRRNLNLMWRHHCWYRTFLPLMRIVFVLQIIFHYSKNGNLIRGFLEKTGGFGLAIVLTGNFLVPFICGFCFTFINHACFCSLILIPTLSPHAPLFFRLFFLSVTPPHPHSAQENKIKIKLRWTLRYSDNGTRFNKVYSSIWNVDPSFRTLWWHCVIQCLHSHGDPQPCLNKHSNWYCVWRDKGSKLDNTA